MEIISPVISHQSGCLHLTTHCVMVYMVYKIQQSFPSQPESFSYFWSFGFSSEKINSWKYNFPCTTLSHVPDIKAAGILKILHLDMNIQWLCHLCYSLLLFHQAASKTSHNEGTWHCKKSWLGFSPEVGCGNCESTLSNGYWWQEAQEEKVSFCYNQLGGG